MRDTPDQTHRIFDWSVPGRLGDRRLTVTGRLDYVPPSEAGVSSVVIVLVAVTATAALLGFGLLLLRLRRGEETAPQAG